MTITENFIKKAKSVHRDRFDYSKVEYVNTKTKVVITCPIHGDFKQNPNKHLEGNGCSKCSGKYKITKEEFIEEANKTHNNKYDYSLVEYKNKKIKVKIICPIHGVFEQSPENHLKGYNCRECNKDARRKHDEIYYVTKTCGICGKEFTRKKKFNSKYCSYECSGKAKNINSREIRICRQCSNEFEERKKYKRDFCSEKCRIEWQLMPENVEKRLKKTKNTMLEKYGVDSLFKLGEFQKKYKELNKDKSKKGMKLAIEGIKKKRENTLIKRFDEINYEILEFIDDNLKVRHPDGHIFIEDRKFLVNRLNHNVELSTKLLPKSAPRSTLELFITSILDEANINYVTNDRNFLNGYEIDILIHDHKLAIEVNGLFWHSELYISKTYHLDKLNKCNGFDYELLHFFEDEIIEKKNIIKSMIYYKLNLLNEPTIINDYVVNKLSDNGSELFFNENHIQGYVGKGMNLGLFVNNELMSAISFDIKSNRCHLIRFCDKINSRFNNSINILLEYIVDNYHPKSILVYADRRYDDLKFYEDLGFDFIENTKPNYYYINNKQRIDKKKWKNNAKKIKIYDCGNAVFEMILTKNPSN